MAAAEDSVRMEGEVVEVLPSATFRVKLENGRSVVGHIAGPLRLQLVRLVPGDRIVVELTPLDLNRCRIIRRVR